MRSCEDCGAPLDPSVDHDPTGDRELCEVCCPVCGPRYPDIEVPLAGEDGNAFSILARVQGALIDGGATRADVDEFYEEATRGDYDHLLRTVMAWVGVR